jgi:hypothetical protein
MNEMYEEVAKNSQIMENLEKFIKNVKEKHCIKDFFCKLISCVSFQLVITTSNWLNQIKEIYALTETMDSRNLPVFCFILCYSIIMGIDVVVIAQNFYYSHN